MKYIAIILATYLLISAFIPSHGAMMPCGSACCDVGVANTSNTSSDEQPSDKKGCASQCASFCCNVITAITPKTSFSIEFISIKPFIENSFHYNSPRGIPFQNIVWQPPQKVS